MADEVWIVVVSLLVGLALYCIGKMPDKTYWHDPMPFLRGKEPYWRPLTIHDHIYGTGNVAGITLALIGALMVIGLVVIPLVKLVT